MYNLNLDLYRKIDDFVNKKKKSNNNGTLDFFEFRLDFSKRSIFGLRHVIYDEQHAQKTETGVEEKRPTRSHKSVHRAGQTSDYPNDYPVSSYGHTRTSRFELWKNKNKTFFSFIIMSS